MSSQLLDVPAKHPLSLSAIADRTWNYASESLMRNGWSPLTRFAEAAVTALMQKVTVGQLRVITSTRIYTFPENKSNNKGEAEVRSHLGLNAELRVVNDTFWVRLCLMGDLGFAEAYMYGDVECDDLVTLFKIFLENRQNLENINSSSMFSFLFTLPQKITSYRFLNTISNSRSNISAHYDISNEMFAGFLSEDMTYSCAIFEDLDADLNNGGVSIKKLNGSEHAVSNGKAYTNGDLATQRHANGYVNGTNGNGHPNQNGFKSGEETNGHKPTNGYIKGNGLTNGHRHGPTNGYISGSENKKDHENGYTNGVEINGDSFSNGFSKLNGGGSWQEKDNDELYVAQIRKLDHIIKKAKIEPGHRVLEIGSGWGSMAIRITSCIPNTTVDTLTLSVQQQELAQKRIAAAGLSDRITVHLMDYRNMPPDWEAAFDRVVSVEMLEAVGEQFLETYWSIVDWALNPQKGAGVVQCITIPETRFNRYRGEIDFIRKWVIFPGGMLPTLTLLLSTIRTGSKNRLIVDSTSNIGPHYARTLREWRRRFLDQFEDLIIPALQSEYPSVMGEGCPNGKQEIEVFKRKWIYYYCYCEIGFTTRTLGDHIITFAREGYQDFGCDVFA